MSLSRKSIKPNSKVILIDDFMRKGGTLKGMEELMKEFSAEVVARGVFMEANPNEKKDIDNYISLIHIQNQKEKKLIVPNQQVLVTSNEMMK